MDELRIVYQIQTDIWHFFKKYGVERLEEDKWDELYRDGDRLLKKYRALNSDMGQLFEDMYIALRKYYQRKEIG
mgnify:FL=1